MTAKFSILAAALLCSVSTAALADGMPFKDVKPKPILTPLENKSAAAKEQPVEMKAAEKTAPPVEAAPVIIPQQTPTPPVQETQAPLPPPPAPEARTVEAQPDSSFLGLSVGVYDPTLRSQRSTAFNLEYQPGVKILGVLQPLFGGMATTDGSLLGYGGLGVPFNVTEHVFVMPSLAVGAYHKGAGVDLDRILVYRGGLELAYQFEDRSRLGLNLSVITNGKSDHREDRAEVATVNYTVPFDTFSGGSASARALTVQAPTPLLSSSETQSDVVVP